jgi:hypothetical protein
MIKKTSVAGISLKRNLIALFLVGAVIMAAAVIAPVLGSPGGVGNKNLQANSCGAHNIVSSSNTVTVTASNLNPAPGEQVTVTASLSGSGGSGNKAGVALFTALSGSSGTAPADKGWSIVSDPSGTTYNYNEKSYGGSASFVWTLKAPATSGKYSLYARGYMGPTFNYKDAASPLSFNVGSATVSNPKVSVTAPASGATVSGTVTVSATASPGTGSTISSVDLRIDSTSVGTRTASPYSWSVSSANYANGAHTLNVTATDSGGRKGYSQIGITINNVAQSPPVVTITTPAAGATLTGTAVITATAKPAGTATIGSVTLSIDGTSIGSKSAAPYTWSVNSVAYAKGTHTILVTATDSNAMRGTAQISVSVNNDPASVTISSPTNGATVSGTVPVTATGTPPAGQTMTGMELKVDGVSKGAVASAPYTWNVNTNDLANGNHVYNVTSTSSGGVHSYAQISVTYNNQPISVSISGPANGATVSGTASVTASIASGQTVTFGSMQVDGAMFNNKTAAPFTWSLDTLTLTNGQHTIMVTGGDSAGRIARQQITVNIENAPASVSVTAPANGALIRGTMTVTANALSSATVSWVRLNMDGTQIGNRTVAPYTWPVITTGYGDGPHTLIVDMMDSLGRHASQQITVILNNTGTAVAVPVVTVTAPTNGASVSGNVTVSAQVTSARLIGSVLLSVDGKAVDQKTTGPYSWTLNTFTLADGQHTLNVSAVDSGGKIGYNLITIQTNNPPPSVVITSPSSGQSLVGTFTVNASVTAKSIRYVALLLDGNEIGNRTAAPFSWSWDSFKLTNGAHTLAVVAMDGNGKRGSQNITVTAGNLPPSTTFASPNASIIGGKTEVIANVTSTEKMKEVVLRMDGTVISSISLPPYSWSIDTTLYSKGGHVLNLTSTNVFGVSSYVEMKVFVDNSGPTVMFVSPSDNSTVFGNVSMTIVVLDPVPITKVILSADGTQLGNMTETPYIWNIDSKAWPDGIHNITVTAFDASGKSNSSSLHITIDNRPPTVMIYAPFDGSNVSGIVKVSANVSTAQPVGNVTLFLDGQMFSSLNSAPYVWTWDSSSVAEGVHVLQVSATDSSGNVAHKNITVLVGPSEVSIDLQFPDIGTGTIDLVPTISAGEPIRNVLFILDGNITGNISEAPYAYSLDSTLVADGPHTLNVTAVTASGLVRSKEFTLDIVNAGGSGGAGAPDLHLGSVDLLILQALLIVTGLAIALKFTNNKKALKKGLWTRKQDDGSECHTNVETIEEGE